MTTSLARQLQAIRSDTVATLDKRKHEKVASILFDSGEAAEQSFNAVHSLGLNGLHGLIQIEPRFQMFEKTLFSETSKEVDRSVLTKADNDTWDSLVNEFLNLVAPHALSREASKALEWLIRRFKIHLFPVSAESLLFAFLPYHAELLYSRLLQIVTLPSKFSFFVQYNDIRTASNLPPVPRQLLIRALSKDPVFLEAYLMYIVERVKSGYEFTAMIGKWTTLIVESILQMRQSRVGDETIVSRIMPFVAQGLGMKQNSNFQIASYTVLTILGSSGTLTDKVVNAAMETICQGWTDNSRRCGILCLVTLAQHRGGDELLPDSVVKSLLSVKDLMSQIESLPSKAASNRLLVPLARKLLASSNLSENHAILSDMTFSSKLSSIDRETIILMAVTRFSDSNGTDKAALGKWLALCSKNHTEAFKSSMLSIVDTLETEQINELETISQLALKNHKDNEMMDVEYTNPTNVDSKASDLWSSLPEELSNPSFFVASPDHSVIIGLWEDAANSGDKSKVERLLSSVPLSKSLLAIPSLLARQWVTVSNSTRSRTAALDQFTEYLIKADAAMNFQGFIPHLIAALSDYSKDVREATAKALTTLHENYPSATKTTVVGLTDMYPGDSGTNALKWLSTSEVKWLVGNVLLPKLPECILDCNYVMRLLGEVLNGAGKKGKKEQNPTSLIIFLASHVVCSGMASLQYPLLRVLNDMSIQSQQAAKLKAQLLEPLLLQCKDANYVSSLLSQEERIDPVDFNELLIEIVGPGSSAAQISVLLDLVRIHGLLSVTACRQLSVVFPAAGQTTQTQIAKVLMNQLENGPSALAKIASATLDAIHLPTQILLSLLDDVKIEFDSRDSSPARKRQRTESARSSPGIIPESLIQSTRRLTLFLEILERQISEQHGPIIAPLFAILDQLIALENETRTALNYPKQMVLSCLISIVKGFKDLSSIDSSLFRIDSLIACVRTSSSPQVHNRTLLLLSALAQIVPELILNHVMPIFTFMGTNVLRQDDEYSAHVVEKTIKSVVPMLASASDDKAIDTTPIIAAFVNNFDFIPRHRRLSLFKVLLETLGAEDHIPGALILLAEKGRSNERNRSAVTDFGADLLNSVPVSVRLAAMQVFLKLIILIPRESDEDVEGLPVNVKVYSKEELDLLRIECLRMVASVLASRSFQNSVVRAFATGDVSIISRDLFSPIVEALLSLAPQSQNTIGELIISALDGVISALPLQYVVNIVETFVKAKKDVKITKNMITIASDRLTKMPAADVTLKTSLTQLLSLLGDMVKSAEDNDFKIAALDCIGQLSRIYGKTELSLFEDLLSAIVVRGIANDENIVIEHSFECLLSMLPVLDARIVPFLPDIMHVMFEQFAQIDDSAKHLRTSLLGFVTGLYERIPTFMTSYVPRLIQIIFEAVESGDQPSNLVEIQDVLIQVIAQNVSTEVCIESLSQCWLNIKHTRRTLTVIVGTLELIIAEGSREDLTSSSKLLFDLFLKIFDVRSEASLKPKVVKNVEAQVSDVFLKLVMKLNDTTFRPFFVTLRDWTFRKSTGETKLTRQIFFYNFLNKFLETLQTVVTAYYGIVLDETIQLLNDFEKGTVLPKELWASMIQSLHKSFAHDLDQDSYWSSPTRFDKVVLPLLSQLKLPFKSTTVIPAIVQLASKAHSEDNFKVINGALMEYMKSESSSVRLAAVNTQRELYLELSGEWLKMLPPTVPVIAEMMEDEDDNVIDATHLLIATIEKVGGISMQKLLT